MKYELMKFKTRNEKTLEEDVCKILDGFGKDYVMTVRCRKQCKR